MINHFLSFCASHVPCIQLSSVTQSCPTLCNPVDRSTPGLQHASLSITNSQSPSKPMSTESVMPSNHLVLYHFFSSPLNLSQHQSFPVSQLFPSGDQITGASPSASVLPMSNTELPLTLLGGSGVVSASFTERCIMFAPARAVAFVPY